MTTHNFAHALRAKVRASFAGRIKARTENTDRPDQYLVTVTDGEREFDRWFFERDLIPIETEEAHENVVPLKVAS